MPDLITLTAEDGQTVRAWQSEPPVGVPLRGGLIVAQEVFGVNDHIRDLTTRFAAHGYRSLAPCFYDRVKPGGFESGYTPEEFAAARAVLGQLDIAHAIADCARAVASLAPAGRVGIVGYCFGGGLAWQAAAKLTGLACAVAYYGSRILNAIELEPRCPVLLHWGAIDHTTPSDIIKQVEARHPTIPSYRYEGAGHGFNADPRASYNPHAAALAEQRTLAFSLDTSDTNALSQGC